MNRRILLPLTAALATVALVLAGCTTSDPKPTHSTTQTAKPSPTPTVGDMAPAQDQVDPPKSSDEAKTAAVKTINLYLHYQFLLFAHPELGGKYLYNYVDGSAQTAAESTAKYYVDHKSHATGGPVVFTPNFGASYTGQSFGANNAIYNDGVAYMIGCADNSAMKFSTDGAAPTPVTTKTTAPDSFTVQWNEKVRTWLVTHAEDLTGQAGAPQC